MKSLEAAFLLFCPLSFWAFSSVKADSILCQGMAYGAQDEITQGRT